MAAPKATAVEAPVITPTPESTIPSVAESAVLLRASLTAYPQTPFASQIETSLNTIEGFLTAR